MFEIIYRPWTRLESWPTLSQQHSDDVRAAPKSLQ